MLVNVVWLISLAAVQAQESAVLYDAYFGKPVSEKRATFLARVTNASVLCTVPVRPCRKEEGRRVDGTCTNPKYPSRGATLSPLLRLLPPQYGPGNSLRPARDGSLLPSARLLRTRLLADGYIHDTELSVLILKVFVFSIVDNVDLFYMIRYGLGSNCCINNQVPNVADPSCIPIEVAADDPYLRRTGIRCLNLTRVETYQDNGCLPQNLPAERYSRVPPLLDLSVVYGNTEHRSREVRANQSGLLSFMMEGDREVPAGNGVFCPRNRPGETSCYNYGDNFNANLLPGTYITAMWFFREHNRIARQLAKLNPCWDDQKLYETARQINIGQWQQIFFYELIPNFIGYKNALAEGIIYESTGYVNDFDPLYEPGVYREYVIGCRWFHTLQNGFDDLYRDGRYVGSRPTVDDRVRSGVLAINNTEADLTEGAISQPADNLDYVIDPDIAERVHAEDHAASDMPAIDMMRGRDAGLPPYNHYRQLCGFKPAKTFKYFEDTIDKDRVVTLSRLYDDVDDVEVMVAIYAERLLPHTYVGPTLFCIMTRNLRLWRRSDKFFFEHSLSPTSFTLPQLNEVRKASMARVLCDSGDSIKRIQPYAFLRKRPWNNVVPCEEIPGTDLSKWKDNWCSVYKKKRATEDIQQEPKLII